MELRFHGFRILTAELKKLLRNLITVSNKKGLVQNLTLPKTENFSPINSVRSVINNLVEKVSSVHFGVGGSLVQATEKFLYTEDYCEMSFFYVQMLVWGTRECYIKPVQCSLDCFELRLTCFTDWQFWKWELWLEWFWRIKWSVTEDWRNRFIVYCE